MRAAQRIRAGIHRGGPANRRAASERDPRPPPAGCARPARELGGGLRPPSEASPQDAVRAAGRRGAGAPPSEASNPENRAAGRRGAGAPPSEASDPEPAPAEPALEAERPPVAAFLVATWRSLRQG